MKIFVIGFNKTGTSSFNYLFQKLNINSIHTTQNVLKIIDKYDAFTDGIHHNFKEYYDKYPNSLFILNTRPIKSWLTSRYKHSKGHYFKECWCWPISEEKTDKWIIKFEKHFKNVLDFFSDKPDRLLVVNIEKKGWENVVSLFIEKNANNISSHMNVRKSDQIPKNIMTSIIKNVDFCLNKNGYNGNEILPKNINISNYQYKTFL
jgi:hypothetical protein